ncbi:hypothetical protein AT239_02655 [Bartonella henselae]|nr:hypothetical protein AT239_02655 [Bartonella henselae]
MMPTIALAYFTCLFPLLLLEENGSSRTRKYFSWDYEMVSYDSLFDLDMRMSGVICSVDGLIINKMVNVQICFCEGAMIHFVHL